MEKSNRINKASNINVFMRKVFTLVASEKCEYHHTALAPGYLSRKKYNIERYAGCFGKGYRIHLPTQCPPPHNRNKACSERANTGVHHVIYFIRINEL